jgi:hypothetical protein
MSLCLGGETDSFSAMSRSGSKFRMEGKPTMTTPTLTRALRFGITAKPLPAQPPKSPIFYQSASRRSNPPKQPMWRSS